MTSWKVSFLVAEISDTPHPRVRAGVTQGPFHFSVWQGLSEGCRELLFVNATRLRSGGEVGSPEVRSGKIHPADKNLQSVGVLLTRWIRKMRLYYHKRIRESRRLTHPEGRGRATLCQSLEQKIGPNQAFLTAVRVGLRAELAKLNSAGVVPFIFLGVSTGTRLWKDVRDARAN